MLLLPALFIYFFICNWLSLPRKAVFIQMMHLFSSHRLTVDENHFTKHVFLKTDQTENSTSTPLDQHVFTEAASKK